MDGATSGTLDLITSKNGNLISHLAPVALDNGTAKATLSLDTVTSVYADAVNGDWDYVEARWTFDSLEAPSTAQFHMLQNSKTYDLAGWPPNR